MSWPLGSLSHSRVTNWPVWPEPQAGLARTVADWRRPASSADRLPRTPLCLSSGNLKLTDPAIALSDEVEALASDVALGAAYSLDPEMARGHALVDAGLRAGIGSQLADTAQRCKGRFRAQSIEVVSGGSSRQQQLRRAGRSRPAT